MKRIFILAIIAILFIGCSLDYRFSEIKKDVIQNDTTIKLSINKDLVASKNIDSIYVRSTLLNDLDIPMVSLSKTFNHGEIDGVSELAYDLKNYGKHEITIYYRSKDNLVEKEYVDYIITADEYNIVSLIATLPVTYYSILYSDADNDLVKSDIPSILLIERANSINWEKLPDNMYPCPFVDYENIISCTTTGAKVSYYSMRDNMAAYIKYLANLNPSSKFNLITGDNSVEEVLIYLHANGLDGKNNSITVFSDGSHTYSITSKTFGQEEDGNSLAKYEDMKQKWNSYKQKALNGDSTYLFDIAKNRDFDNVNPLSNYMPILINDPTLDVKWIMSMPTRFMGNTDVVNNLITGNSSVQRVNVNTVLSGLSTSETEVLKTIFKYNDAEFGKAEKENKKVMIFLGTSFAGETNISDYLKFMVAYSGDEYAFFYKGHPGYGTSDEVKAVSKELGITILEASIPAELFIYFNPAVEMCGYNSTTYDSYNNRIKFIPGDYNGTNLPKLDAKLISTLDAETPYKVVRLSDNKVCAWDPNNPTLFDWKDEN